MARQNMRVSPSQKHMHVYQRFDGGLNTVDANEKIADHELADLTNKDLGERGSLKRRHGMVNVTTPVFTWSSLKITKWSEL